MGVKSRRLLNVDLAKANNGCFNPNPSIAYYYVKQLPARLIVWIRTFAEVLYVKNLVVPTVMSAAFYVNKWDIVDDSQKPCN